MGKFEMPNVKEFLKRKKIFGPIKDPVWVYLKREMEENMGRKPYNTRVANWLSFLRDLRYHYFCQAKYNYERLRRECGPKWFIEFSKEQRKILSELKDHIHEDILDELPLRVRKDFSDLGLNVSIPDSILVDTMTQSKEDPGVFIWLLYQRLYKASPSQLQPYYDPNAMLLMSALCAIDLKDCLYHLEKLVIYKQLPPSPEPKQKRMYYEPKTKYGAYLQRMRVPFYSRHPEELPNPKKPLPLANTIKLRSPEVYEKLRFNTDFLEKRKESNLKKARQEKKKCHYKFWDPPPSCVRDPKLFALAQKMKLLKEKAKKTHLKYKPHFDNMQFILGTVSYIWNNPIYVLSTVVILPTGHVLINAGLCKYGTEYVIQYAGMVKSRESANEQCIKNCTCSTDCTKIADFLNTTKCTCLNPYNNDKDKNSTEKFFSPSTKHVPLIFDYVKIYQLDLYSNIIELAVKNALASKSSLGIEETGVIDSMPNHELLKVFLADLADTHLIIPHLPQANVLNSLLEWVRQKTKGNLTQADHKQLMQKTQRRWVDLSHIDFRARAYFIPFTHKELNNMTWSHRGIIKKLFTILIRNYEARNRAYQAEQSRLWWSTMAYDAYPSDAFLDLFFTYMPMRSQDTLVLNPFIPSGMNTTRTTCPLDHDNS